jgi:peptidyl-prolyl cis-trans isomerase SurA
MVIKYFFNKVIIVILFLFWTVASANQDKVMADKIIAVVNGDVITQSELNNKIAMFNRMAAQDKNMQNKNIRQLALDSIIDSLLQLQAAQRIGLKVPDAELDDIVANVAKKNNLSVEQLKQALQEKEGINFKEYQRQIREQILINRAERAILGKDIAITDQEIAEILRNPPKMPANSMPTASYHVADILFELPDGVSAEKLKKTIAIAKKFAAQLKPNKDINALIQEYNMKGYDIKNVDLEWRKINELPNIFANVVVGMQRGQVSSPLIAPNGIHLLRLLEKQGDQVQQVKFSKDQAQEFLYQQKIQAKLKDWLKELRAKAYIKIYVKV